VSSINCDHC